ncbi:ABC transporter substrate-binding protein [Bengtsoniella intestinalis]|uniref:ABC transporter substrate-binding protein n=1 Tax=Bengtsoniella intestinalis TaxID=3073143 RepID=UPI00391F9227
MTKAKKALALLLSLATMASLVACSSSSDSTESTTTSTTTATDGAVILNIAAEIIGEGLDHTYDWNSWTDVRYGVTETLTRFAQDGSLEPWLAESWESNDEATVWTFKLREDVCFSNGTPMTATKVKDSIEYLYTVTDVDNGGKGYPQAYFTYTSIEADDEAYTVTITSDSPIIDMLGCMGYPWMCIVDTDGIEDRDLQVEGPIGTGPYVVTHYEKANILELAANENYWDGDVHYDVINAVYISDAKTRALALMDGSADLSFNITQADRTTLEASGISVEIAAGSRIGNSYFNQDGPLGNQTLRQAVLMAIDGPAIAEVTSSGSYVYDYSVVPTSYAFGGSELVFPYDYDPDAAMALLDDAGIVDTDGDGWRELDGEKITLNYVASNFRYMDVIPQAHMALIEAIGVDVNLTPTDGHFEILYNKDFDIIVNSEVTLPTGDPQQFLGRWYGADGNYSDYSNAEYDALYQTLRATVDTDERVDIIGDLQQILIDDAATMVWGFYGSNVCYTENVTDVVASTSDYYWVTKDTKPAN